MSKFKRQQYDDVDIIFMRMEAMEKRIDMIERLLMNNSAHVNAPSRAQYNSGEEMLSQLIESVKSLQHHVEKKDKGLTGTSSARELADQQEGGDGEYEEEVETSQDGGNSAPQKHPHDPRGLMRRRTVIT
jgi:flagellar hook-basal body complex protein FliE